MHRFAVLLLTAIAAAPAVVPPAAVPTPDRPLTDPHAIVSRANPDAKPIPIDDLGYGRRLDAAVWSADGKRIFMATNLTGRMNVWRMDADGSFPVQLVQSDDAASGLVPSPDGRTLYYAQDKGGDEMHDLYAVPVGGGAPVNLTRTPEQREQAVTPAPDGRSIAFSFKPKAAGDENIAVMDLATHTVRPVTHDADSRHRWHPVGWADNGSALIAERQNADESAGEVWRIDVASGTAQPVLVRPRIFYAAAAVAKNGMLIAVTSGEGAGRPRAGLFDTATGQMRWLKPTPWEQRAVALSPDGRRMLVQTDADGYSDLSLVDTDTMAEAPVTLDRGSNTPIGDQPFAPDGARLLAVHSAGNAPAELTDVDLTTGKPATIARFALASLGPDVLPPSRVITYSSFDGTRISAVLTLPFNLKRDGSNPAVVIAHGGPRMQTSAAFSPLAAALASRGYVVIAPNPRGSSGYGGAFARANFQDLGGGDLKDELAAKDFLVATGYVNAGRVGITGGSYGGFMTLMAIGRAPDAFAAGVQMYGIVDWRTMWTSQDAMMQAYQRTLLGPPEGNDAVYDAASPLTYLMKAKAPLLSLQGENDIRVPRGQAQKVTDTLKARGNVAEVVFYPGEGHGFRKRETVVDTLRRTVDWFDRYLKPARR